MKEAVRCSSMSVAMSSWRLVAQSTCRDSDIVVELRMVLKTRVNPHRVKNRVAEAAWAWRTTAAVVAVAFAMATTAASGEVVVGTARQVSQRVQTRSKERIVLVDVAEMRTARLAWRAGCSWEAAVGRARCTQAQEMLLEVMAAGPYTWSQQESFFRLNPACSPTGLPATAPVRIIALVEAVAVAGRSILRLTACRSKAECRPLVVWAVCQVRMGVRKAHVHKADAVASAGSEST